MTMPRAKKPKVLPNETAVIQLEGQDTHVEVWNNPADEGGRGAHMLSKRYKAFDQVLIYCEKMLNSPSDIQKKSFTKHVNGETTIKRFGEIIVQIVKPTKIGKTLSEDIVHMVRSHYKPTLPYRNLHSAKK
jgi:hypothetical protein